jgi:spermidine/putrescine transport system ATP-binding protein
MPEPMVELRSVTKRFGTFTAVERVCLQVQRGEFLTLLGPSGCGKTTLLRMISGFETPTEGTVWIGGEDVTQLPPYKRDANQVFQSYALFPHLTVAENIAFGLKMRGLSRGEIGERVKKGVELVSLQGKENTKPSALSGGQKQRVALARAVVCQPKVLLLDEPLSALDAKLRHQMQIELKHLQRTLGITFIFVTHDQEEALTISDRIAVVNGGKIEQIGPAYDIYHAPQTRFVANFVGQANLLPGRLVHATKRQGISVMVNDSLILSLEGSGTEAREQVHIAFRPEKICLTRERPTVGENIFAAEVLEEIFRGQTDELRLRVAPNLEITAVVANESATQECFHKGDRVWCHLLPQDIVLLAD